MKIKKLKEAIKKICERNKVDLETWIEIESEFRVEEKARICSKCGHMEL